MTAEHLPLSPVLVERVFRRRGQLVSVRGHLGSKYGAGLDYDLPHQAPDYAGGLVGGPKLEPAEFGPDPGGVAVDRQGRRLYNFTPRAYSWWTTDDYCKDFGRAFALILEGCCPMPGCERTGQLGPPPQLPAGKPMAMGDGWRWAVCSSCQMRWAAWFPDSRRDRRALAWGWPDQVGYQAVYE